MNENTFEDRKTPERPPDYEKVVFGHEDFDFDRDQFITYYFALRSGAIPADAELIFTSNPSKEDLDSSKVCNIEGIPAGYTMNDKASGNFENDPKSGVPAAAKFYETFQRDFSKEFGDYANNIMRWITAAELHTKKDGKKEIKPRKKRKGKERPDPLKPEDLWALTDIFYGLKAEHGGDMDTFIKEALAMMDTLVDPERLLSMKDLYAEAISLSKRNETKDQGSIEALLAKQPERFKFAVSDNGTQMAYIDVRGSNTSTGAFEAAKKQAKTHGLTPTIILLVSDAMDNTGELVGSRFMLQLADSSDDTDLRKLLGPRLHYSEALLGKGYLTEFGGHKNMLGSDREKGSGLVPEELWVALQGFFDIPRYTEESLMEFAGDKLGLKNAFPGMAEAPGTAYDLPERALYIGLHDDGSNETRITSISESDLPLYEEYLSKFLNGNVDAFRSMLKQKTAMSEPQQIATYRALKADIKLREVADNPKQMTKALDAIDDLNPAQIEGLSFDLQLQILQSIAKNDKAIDMIWNKDNLRYKVVTNQVDDWLKNDIEMYKAGRYTYMSVPYKIDKHLVYEVASQALKSKDLEVIKQVGDTLIGILKSKPYKDSHTEVVYDQLLHSVLRFCTGDELIALEGGPEVAAGLLKQLKDSYGADMTFHWNEAVRQGKSVFLTAMENVPEAKELFADLGLEIPLEREAYQLELWSPATVTAPDPDKIRQSIEQQQEKSKPPVVTYMIKVNRNIDQILQRDGLYRQGEDDPEKDVTLVGSVEVRGYLKIGRGSTEVRQLKDLLLTIVTDMSTIIKEHGQDAQIRILTGGFPGELSRDITAIFNEEMIYADDQGDKDRLEALKQLQKQLIFSDYNTQDKKIYDKKFIDMRRFLL